MHSALPSAIARRLCPSAVFLPGDHAAYAAASREVHGIFADVTPLIEPLALDEAFLDVTGARALLGDGVTIARQLRADDRRATRADLLGRRRPQQVPRQAGLRGCQAAGHARRVRPGPGVVEVRPGAELAYLHPLPVGRLWGVGPATLERLRRMGVSSVGDLAALEPAAVLRALGRAHGRHLLDLAAGRDDRPVEVAREVKSIGHEETFAHDLHDIDDVRRELVRLADAVAARLRAAGTAGRTFTLKVRDPSFTTTTRAVSITGAVDTAEAIVAATGPLLDGIDLGRRRPPARAGGVEVRRPGRAAPPGRPRRRAGERRGRGAGAMPARPSTGCGSASATPRSGRPAASRPVLTVGAGCASCAPAPSNGGPITRARRRSRAGPAEPRRGDDASRALRDAPKPVMM